MRYDRLFVVGLTRFLPPWLSSFALAWLFWMLLRSPARFGWETAAEFETLLYVEIALVLAAVLVLPMRGGALSVPAGLLVIVSLGIVLSASVSPLVAALIALHLGARIGAAWRADDSARDLVKSFAVSAILLAITWFTAGLFWQHEGGWTTNTVPLNLWWEVPSPQGTRRMPHGFPLMGFLYFSGLTIVEVLPAAGRYFRSELTLGGPPTESA
jgi:hypothetical protein